VIVFAICSVVTGFPTNDRTGAMLATTERRNGFPTKRLFVVFAAGKAQKKQIELTRKLEIAKQQHQAPSSTNSNVTNTFPGVAGVDQNKSEISDDDRLEMKRSEFSLLLAQFNPPVVSKDTYRSQVQTRKSTSNVIPPKKTPSKKVAPTKTEVTPSSIVDEVPLQVGDKARRIHFETLIDVMTKQPLGSMGAAKLVPWVPPFIHNKIIIVNDPRKQSSEFRTALQYLESSKEQRKESSTNIIGITSDTAEEMIAYVAIQLFIIFLLQVVIS
jgi:hypothetical protein